MSDMQKFKEDLNNVDSFTTMGRDQAVNNIKDDFSKMSTEDRAQALELIRQHNESSNVKVAVEMKGNHVSVAAESHGMFFGARQAKSSDD